MNLKTIRKINLTTVCLIIFFFIFSMSVLAQNNDRSVNDTEVKSDLLDDIKSNILERGNVEKRSEVRTLDKVYSERGILSENERLNEVRETVRKRVRQVEERVIGNTSNIEERRSQMEGRFNEQRQNAAKNYADNIIRRLNSLVNRLESSSQRISQRIERLENLGFNLASSRILLEEVSTSLEKLQEEIKISETLIEESVNSETPRESMAMARELMLEARNRAREIHQILVSVIVEIRANIEIFSENQGIDNNDENEENVG